MMNFRSRTVRMARTLWMSFGTLALALLVDGGVAAQERGIPRLPRNQYKSGSQVLGAAAPLVAAARAATVEVLAGEPARRVSLGTIVTRDGWVFTKASALAGDESLHCRLADGRQVAARLDTTFAEHDLALLEIESDETFQPGSWSERPPSPGQWVVLVGQDELPLGLGVVGTPVREVRSQPGYLGIRMKEAPGGVRIVEVLSNTPAARAGLLAGDLVVQVADHTVDSQRELSQAIRARRAGDDIVLRLERAGAALDLVARLTEHMPDAGSLENATPVSERRSGFPAVFDTDLPVAPDRCGGPVLDRQGHLLGIVIARAARTTTYVLPATILADLLNRLDPTSERPREDL